MNYYSTVTNNNIMKFFSKYMDLEKNILSEFTH